MAQTGTIYGYHDGNTYSLANVYDEKASELEFDSLSNSGLPSGCITCTVIHFDTDTGILFERQQISGAANYSPEFYRNDLAAKVTNTSIIKSYITTENPYFDFCMHLKATDKTIIKLVNSIPRASNSSCAFTAEGWFYLDTSTESGSGKFFTFCCSYRTTSSSTASGLIDSVSFAYTSTTAEIFVGDSRPTNWIYVNELNRSVFDNPIHIAYVFGENNQPLRIYVNGKLYCYSNALYNNNYYSYTVHTLQIGAHATWQKSAGSFYATTPYTSIYFGEWRGTSGARYHDNFTPQSFKAKTVYIPANMLIRHNAANHYIPLTADAANTSAPYIAVRHGNTNFYTLK